MCKIRAGDIVRLGENVTALVIEDGGRLRFLSLTGASGNSTFINTMRPCTLRYSNLERAAVIFHANELLHALEKFVIDYHNGDL